MSSKRLPAAVLALVCWLVSGAAMALSHRDISYRDDAEPLQSLDVHAPEAPGPHPVVVFVHGGRWRGGDKADVQAQSAAFTAQGYVFVSVNYRLAPSALHPAQVEDCAAALAWVSRRIADYGGDPTRIHLMGQGAGAQLAALVATDARRLAAHGLGPDMLRGLLLFDSVAYDLVESYDGGVPEDRMAIAQAFGTADATKIDGSPVAHVTASHPLPPALIFFSGGRAGARMQAERLADRLRGAGVSAQVQTTHERNAGGPEHEFGAPGDLPTSQAFAWLRALQIARVQRFENLVFAREAAFTEAAGTAVAPAPVLRAHAGAIYAGMAGSGAGARVLRKDTTEGEWQNDAAFEPRYGALIGLEHATFSTDAAGAPLAKSRGVLVALLAGADGRVHVSSRDDALATWSRPRALALGARAGATSAGIAHRDAVTGVGSYVVATSAASAAVQRLIFDGAPGSVAAAPAAEAIGAFGAVEGLAVANGVLYAAIGRSTEDEGGLYRRVDGTTPRWERAASWPASGALHALATVPDPQGTGSEVLIGASAQGTIERIDPRTGYTATRELDFRTAFSDIWHGLGEDRVVTSSAFTALRQPDSNDLVHAIGLALVHPDAHVMPYNGAYYLVRQLDASYSYGLAHDFATPGAGAKNPSTLRSMLASPFVEEGGRVVYFGGDTAGAGPWALRARLNRATLAQGLWWDRARPGHGLSLHPAGERWLATLYTYDEAGEPTWYVAVGEIDSGRFVADSSALAHYRLRPGAGVPQQRDAAKSGAIALDFGAGSNGAGCRDGVDRHDATALAAMRLELGGRVVDWCLEPIDYGAPGLPSVDTSGVWFDGSPDAGWGLMLAPRGYDGSTREAGIVFFYDGRGEPRWALGAGDAARGAAAFDLRSYAGYCPGCAARPVTSQPVGALTHQLQGYCGEVAGTTSIMLAFPGEAGGRLVVDNAPLQPLSTPRCY